MRKSELFLEEAVLDDLDKSLDCLEQPLPRSTFSFLGIAILSLSVLVVLRVLFLGIWRGDFYSQRALLNAAQTEIVIPERGVIFDRFDKPLVKNIPVFRLSLKLVELLKDPEEKNKTTSALEAILNLPPKSILKMVENADLEKQNAIIVARQIGVEEVIKIKNLNLPAVQIENDFRRHYSEPEVFAHLIGYTGSVDKNDLNANPSLFFNETIGKGGLEAFYDKELRGENGEKVNYRNTKGEIIDVKSSKNPRPGGRLYSTIDAELQSFFYKTLKARLDILGSRSGVGIAMNPQNGEILALISLPSFNANEIKRDDLINSYRPFFNRAVSGVYSPGSTIKPLVALAALEESVISPEKEIFSAGYLEIPNPYFPDKPSRFLDWKPHGWVNLYSAIARSSNVYFYEVGGGYGNQKGLGIEKLKDYWRKFGFEEKTGVDLPSENKGVLPDPSLKEKRRKDIWRIGDTYNVAIGQGDLSVTPLELLNYISALANGGKFYRPFAMEKIAAEDGTIVKKNNSQIIKDYSSEIADSLPEIGRGMIDAVEKSYGTANLLADLPFSIAAKTGTSQIEFNAKVNAFFVGYAPADPPVDGPQIAILVLIENAREGSLNAVPVAKEVLKWYYENRLKQ